MAEANEMVAPPTPLPILLLFSIVIIIIIAVIIIIMFRLSIAAEDWYLWILL